MAMVKNYFMFPDVFQKNIDVHIVKIYQKVIYVVFKIECFCHSFNITAIY